MLGKNIKKMFSVECSECLKGIFFIIAFYSACFFRYYCRDCLNVIFRACHSCVYVCVISSVCICLEHIFLKLCVTTVAMRRWFTFNVVIFWSLHINYCQEKEQGLCRHVFEVAADTWERKCFCVLYTLFMCDCVP